MAGSLRSYERVLERDPITGKMKWFHWDGTNQTFTIETVQDVEDLVESNLEFQNQDTGKFGEFHRVASVPMTVYLELREKGFLRPENKDRLRAWLNDRDNLKFRTKLGRV